MATSSTPRQALFFDASQCGGGAGVLPSVFALWRLPTLLRRRVTLRHATVSHYLVGKGADLMLPGIDPERVVGCPRLAKPQAECNR